MLQRLREWLEHRFRHLVFRLHCSFPVASNSTFVKKLFKRRSDSLSLRLQVLESNRRRVNSPSQHLGGRPKSTSFPYVGEYHFSGFQMYLTDGLLTHINLLFYLHSKARVFPLRIASITENMCLPAEAQDELPLSLVETVMGSLRHVSTRLTAHRIASSLEKLQPREAALKTRVVQKRIDRATSAPNLRDKMKAQRARAASPSLLSTKTRLPQAQSRLAFPRSPVTESPRNRSDVSLLNDTVMTENRSNAGSEQAHPANSALPAPSYIATQLLTFPPASRSRRGSSTSISQDDSAHSQASTQLSSHLGEETEGTSRGEATQKEMEELEELRSMNPEEDPMECSTLPKSMPQSLPDALHLFQIPLQLPSRSRNLLRPLRLWRSHLLSNLNLKNANLRSSIGLGQNLQLFF